MSRRSGSGVPLAIIDQAQDQEPTLTLVAGGTVALDREVMTYVIVKSAGNLAGSTIILLPASPNDGDEVVIASMVTFVDPGTQFLLINGNGHDISPFGSPYNGSHFSWLKFSKSENVWLALHCCVFEEGPG